MKFEKGQSGNPTGRPKGAQNIITKTIRESVLEAYHELQKDKQANIIAWGRKQPGLFYQIAARLIPTEINANLTGKLEITTPSWFDNGNNQTAYHLLPTKTEPETLSN